MKYSHGYIDVQSDDMMMIRNDNETRWFESVRRLDETSVWPPFSSSYKEEKKKELEVNSTPILSRQSIPRVSDRLSQDIS